MDPVAGTQGNLARAAVVLEHVDARLDPAYQAMKAGRIALGDAPISLGTMAINGGLKAALGPAAVKQHPEAFAHAGLAADGLLRGLLYPGGVAHNAAKRAVPWLVSSKSAPGKLAGVASRLGKVANYARLTMLGISGALGAIRAAKAVVAASGDARALLTTRDGRGGALQAVGSALLMIKHPVTYFAGAGVFLAAIVNDVL